MRAYDIVDQHPKRRGSRPSALFVALLVALAVAVLIRRKQIPYDQRAVNKRWLNPLMMRFAGQQWFPHAVIVHQGRASGRLYTTPVYTEPVIGGFVIPLPYGTQVDWLRNVLADGHATIRWHGGVYGVAAPVVVDVQSPLPGLSRLRRALFRLLGAKEMLLVQVAPVAMTTGKS